MSSKTTAKVIGDALIINLQTSVWRCSLDKLDHAVFTIKTKGKKHNLLLKILKDEENIASFDSKEDAEKALKTVIKALLSPIVGAKRKSWLKRIFYILFFLFILYAIAWYIVPKIRSMDIGSTQISSQQSSGTIKYVTPKNMAQGVPMSADQMFGE